MTKLFATFLAIAALGMFVIVPADAKLGEKAKAAISNSYKCQSGKMVRGKKGCKEFGGSN